MNTTPEIKKYQDYHTAIYSQAYVDELRQKHQEELSTAYTKGRVDEAKTCQGCQGRCEDKVQKAVEERDKEWNKAINVVSSTEIHINPDAIMRLATLTNPD